jgi:membrane protein
MIGGVQRFGARVFEFWWGRGIADDVPSLAYYLLLSLGPFALGVASVQALLLDDVVSALQVATQINRFLPEAVHGDIQQLIVNTRANSPWLLALAIVTMLWTSSGAIGVIERCESRVLDCSRHDVVTGRLRNVALGALVGLAFAISSGSAPVIGEAASLFDLRGALPGGLLFLLNAAGSVVMFAVVYRYAPRSRIGWKPAFLGAVPAGAAIQAVPWLVGLYFGAAAGFAAVRLFLLLAVLLLGLYTMAAVLLVGAGIASSGENRIRRRDDRFRRLPGTPEGMIHHRDQDDRAPDAVLSR